MTRQAYKTRGFSLIELLVVIAIISILAALLFPAIMGARRNAKRNACASNMAEIATGLRMYRLDTGEYPPVLYGFLDANKPVGPAAAVYGLYPHWVRSQSTFVCPDNAVMNGPTLDNIQIIRQVGAGYAAGLNMVFYGPPVDDMRSGAWTDDAATSGTPTFPKGIYFAKGDSYDLSYVGPGDPPGTPERHYQRQWLPKVDLTKVDPATKPWFLPGPTAEQKNEAYARQLVFKLPDDSTLVTMCSYHREYTAGWAPGGSVRFPAGSMDLCLYLDGHVRTRPSNETARYANIGGRQVWSGWQIPGR